MDYEEDPQHYIHLGCSHRDLKQYDKAIEEFNRVLEINPEHLEADYHLGLCYYEKKDLPQALTYFNKALKLSPNEERIHQMLGTCYHALKETHKAIEEFRQILAINPNSQDGHLGLGFCYLEQRQTEKMFDEFKQVLKLNVKNDQAHFGLGLHYRYDKQLDKAIDELKQALKINTKIVDAHQELGEVYLEQKMYNLAQLEFEQTLQLNADNLSARQMLGTCYHALKETHKAMGEFRKILATNPNNQEGHFGLGLCCYEKGEFSKAREEFKRVLEINPRHLQADYQLGLCYFQKKEFSQALGHFKQTIMLDPQNKYVYCQLGQVYFEQRQYDLALEAFKKVIKINPKMSFAHQALGTIYLEQSLYSLAEIEFKQTVLLDADNIFARQMLGYSYRKQGKHDLAVNEFIKTTNFCLEKGKINKEHIGFKAKIIRMPDFCDKIKDYPAELYYTLLPPLALGQIVAYLRANAVEVDQDDLNIKIHYDNHYSRMTDKGLDTTVFFDENRILKYISGVEDQGLELIMEDVAKKSGFYGYSVILLSLREIYINSSCLMFTLSLSRFLKKKYNPILILGGSCQSIDLLNKYDCKDIDYIIYGEGETILLRLLLALKDKAELSKFLNSRTKTNGKFISTELTDVYPPLKPDFSGLPIDKYRYLGFNSHYNDGSCEILEEFNKSGTLLLPFKFIKGCPYECVFCPMAINKSMYVLDPATVALYLKELQEEHNPTGFFFLSDTINISRQYVNELCDEIIKNKTKILWSDCARADNLNRDTLFKMRQAGCIRLIFGIETASSRLLKYIRKGIGVKRLEATLRWSDEAGIWTGVEIICGLPHEDDSDVEETIAFLNKNKRYINTLYINQFDLRDGSTFLPQAKNLGVENIFIINQYANEEFSNFHKYGYDEIGGLRWQDKRRQIINSYKKLLNNTEGNSFFTYELEHLLFFLYNKFGDKQKVCDMYTEIELKTKNVQRMRSGEMI